MSLARLRARGQMVEIRQADLRFSPQECTDFLGRVMGLELSPQDVTALERRTEGWIAGLQLAALSMQGCDDLPAFIKAFSGSSYYVLEYLISEVFAQQPTELQSFLLSTSILDRLCGSLCDVVAGRTDSVALLDRLEHANLFLITPDQSRTWYRYHRLFAELLRQRLHSRRGGAEAELHRLASRWFAAEGLLPEAIQHALAAADWDAAVVLISQNTVAMLRTGELFTLLGWAKALPDEKICQHPQLCRDYGWALSLTGQLDAADHYLRRAEIAAQGDDDLLATILVGLAYNLRVRGDTQVAIETALRARTMLPPADQLSHSLVELTLGLSYLKTGDLPAAEQALLKVDQAAQRSQNHYARMTALTYLGIIQSMRGRLHQAAELCRQVIQLGGQSPTVAPAHIELGARLYEWNDLEAAARHLEIGIQQSGRMGNIPIQSEGYYALATLQRATGDYQGTLDTLLKAQGGELKGYIQTLLAAFESTHPPLPAQGPVDRLSEGELDVLRLMAQGLSNAEIASRLVVTLGTVKTHVHSIFDKLSTHSRTQAVARARQLNLL